MIRVNGQITLSSKLKSTLNERKLKQNTHLKQDLCSGFTRLNLKIPIHLISLRRIIHVTTAYDF